MILWISDIYSYSMDNKVDIFFRHKNFFWDQNFGDFTREILQQSNLELKRSTLTSVCNTGVFSSFCSVENKYRINVRVNYSYVLYIFQIIHIFGQVSYLCLRRNEYSALLCLNFVRARHSSKFKHAVYRDEAQLFTNLHLFISSLVFLLVYIFPTFNHNFAA